MNFEYFIAKRLIKGKEQNNSIAAPILKIAIFAIAIGMIMMLVTVATGVGLQHKIREKVAAFNGHISITSYDNNNSVESWAPISKNQEFYPRFKNVDGISHVQVYATKAGIIRTASDFEGIVVKGIDTDYNWNVFEDYLITGRLPDIKKDQVSNEILLSEHIANRLNLKVGDKAITYFLKRNARANDKPNIRALEIVGIYSSGFQQFDESFAFTDIAHIRRMNKWEEDEVGGFEVFIDDFDAIDQKGAEVYEEIPSTLDSKTIALKYATIFEWLKLFDLNIIGIISIIIIVAGINMITALLVLILERTPLIGIFKALGTTNWSIRKIFLYNAAYLILKGLFWGNLIGIGLLLIQQQYEVIRLNPATYYVNTAPVYLNVGYILLLNAGTLILCLIMLLVPSYIISRISPVKAIRFQ
ncbi:ABC transporter permease [Aquimarina intermedia]|uniref:Lipoprotein-releasing system permease protein n=1 Tax=Aquimarina intermedia TaxID=350814 RepID=A0A5S5BXQ8_9FLAO|nr:FtsX-like permease family protein [Aquimarina intermedia]TYP70972.1 lipoprotein-releasing system permease protein [Aquimarina intermedia]